MQNNVSGPGPRPAELPPPGPVRDFLVKHGLSLVAPETADESARHEEQLLAASADPDLYFTNPQTGAVMNFADQFGNVDFSTDALTLEPVFDPVIRLDKLVNHGIVRVYDKSAIQQWLQKPERRNDPQDRDPLLEDASKCFFTLKNVNWIANNVTIHVGTKQGATQHAPVDWSQTTGPLPWQMQMWVRLLHQKFTAFQRSRMFETGVLPAFFDSESAIPLALRQWIGGFLELFEKAGSAGTQRTVLSYVWGDNPLFNGNWASDVRRACGGTGILPAILKRFDPDGRGADELLDPSAAFKRGGAGMEPLPRNSRVRVQPSGFAALRQEFNFAFSPDQNPQKGEFFSVQEGDEAYEVENGTGIVRVVLVSKHREIGKHFQFIVAKTRLAGHQPTRSAAPMSQPIDSWRDSELWPGHFKPDNEWTEALACAIQARYGSEEEKKAGLDTVTRGLFNPGSGAGKAAIAHGWCAAGNAKDEVDASHFQQRYTDIEGEKRAELKIQRKEEAATRAYLTRRGSDEEIIIDRYEVAKLHWLQNIFGKNRAQIEANEEFWPRTAEEDMPSKDRFRVFLDDWMRVKMGEKIQDPELKLKMARLTNALEQEPVARRMQAPGEAGGAAAGRGAACGTGGAPISQLTYAAKMREELPHVAEPERRKIWRQGYKASQAEFHALLKSRNNSFKADGIFGESLNRGDEAVRRWSRETAADDGAGDRFIMTGWICAGNSYAVYLKKETQVLQIPGSWQMRLPKGHYSAGFLSRVADWDEREADKLWDLGPADPAVVAWEALMRSEHRLERER
mmetsp:Transcript_1646/g.2806  ORF Transcript_1646/g.2806 Transcript_1646/m.2806 type:complete len:794 (-) Transcript_1646:1230-3611(-)